MSDSIRFTGRETEASIQDELFLEDDSVIDAHHPVTGDASYLRDLRKRGETDCLLDCAEKLSWVALEYVGVCEA